MLPRARRQEWTRDIVYCHIDEINGRYDQLQNVRPRALLQERAAAAAAHIERILEAARWKADAFRAHAWEFAQSRLDRPEDAFGPAVLLLCLPGDHPSDELRAWLKALPRQVVRTLVLVGASSPIIQPSPSAPSRRQKPTLPP